MEDLSNLDLSKDRYLISIRSNGKEMGQIDIENGKIVTSGLVGINTFNNLVELVNALCAQGITIDDFYFKS